MAEGVPVAAIQHGVIYRWHTGYMHRTRPPELRLPDRTYVFGQWERRLSWRGTSVYAPDEVLVGGSPRLDLGATGGGDPAAVRAELGVGRRRPDGRRVRHLGSYLSALPLPGRARPPGRPAVGASTS